MSIYRRKEKLPWQRIDDQVIIIHPKNQKVHELNEVASFVWQKLDGQVQLSEIITTVFDEFEDVPTSVHMEIEQLMSDFQKEGLVECL
ncbi:MAG: PqqD family protein [Bdellovibrionales bacterium]|nr:PqqD family protein [Bdellovibrionales bacterium]